MKTPYPIQIRFRDLDPLSHVNNTVFFVYFQEAQGEYFEQLSPWLERWPSQEEDQDLSAPEVETIRTTRINTTTVGAHYGFLIKHNECTYYLPMIHTDKAEIDAKVTHIGRTSIALEFQAREIADPTRIYATARTVLVWCNYHTGRPSLVPPRLRSAIERAEGRSF